MKNSSSIRAKVKGGGHPMTSPPPPTEKGLKTYYFSVCNQIEYVGNLLPIIISLYRIFGTFGPLSIVFIEILHLLNCWFMVNCVLRSMIKVSGIVHCFYVVLSHFLYFLYPFIRVLVRKFDKHKNTISMFNTIISNRPSFGNY